MQRKIITVGSTKGGVGKTTLALNIAIGLALRGRSVWMIDTDQPAAAARALQARRDSGRTPAVASSHHPSGAVLRAQVLHHIDKYQYIVIDAGSGDQSALRTALLLSDTVLVPFQARALDLWALPKMASLIDSARGMRDGLEALAVLNMADAGGTDNPLAAHAAGGCSCLKYVDTPIGRRKSISAAAGYGMSVFEHHPKDEKANAEMNALLSVLCGVHEKSRKLVEQAAFVPAFQEPSAAFQPLSDSVAP